MEQQFTGELNALLKKYNASMISSNTTIRVMFWDEKGNVKSKMKTHSFNLKKD